MTIYPFDSSLPDDDVLQDMEEFLYNPLPEGLVERDWLDLPDIEQEWLDTPDRYEPNYEEHMHSDTLDLDQEF